ncbi:MAG: hypothetical protein HQ471_07755 [Flavobacteriales bacterium]|nr:hypothetical protein [Flavobacteriales bacterium]
MIKTLSSYYLSIPFNSPLTGVICTEYTINLYIWSGLKASVPVTPDYTITKKNLATSTGTDKVNIARLLNDYIDFTPNTSLTTSLISHNNQKWVHSEVVYTTTNVLDLNVKQIPLTDLVVRGYGYGIEGENPTTPTNQIHISGLVYKVNLDTIFTIPIKLNEI